ncbi:unnamed protein product [Ascophyllum nodosum]
MARVSPFALASVLLAVLGSSWDKVVAADDIMTIPDKCTGTKSSMKWASGTGHNGRIYLKDGGCGTMTDLYKFRAENDGWTPKGPLYILDDNDDIMYSPTSVTGKWLLTSDLFVLTGSIFYCRGTNIGGDCDELRIQSTGSTDFHEVRGHGGSLYFENTLVTSWDTPKKSPQDDYKNGRSFINCVSEYESDETCEGQPKNDYGECRMDIIGSEMGYLGWFDAESYGLTWKVRGYCADESNPEVFDTTNVYGDIKNSDIHHMYYGMYSYGQQGGVWTNNKMHDNHQYGFDPHDDSDYLTIANNEVYDNVNHGIIASKRCNNVKIYDNEVYNGGSQAVGIFLHRSSDSCEVYDNVVHDMQDAGMAIMESFDADIHDNTFTNVKYGIRISLGGGNNNVYDNVFDQCSKYGLYTYQGSDAPDASSDGRLGDNSFYSNTISNTETGMKIAEADDTVITGNTFTGTSLLEFKDAQDTVWSSNTFKDADSDLCYKNFKSSTFASTDETLPPLC